MRVETHLRPGDGQLQTRMLTTDETVLLIERLYRERANWDVQEDETTEVFVRVRFLSDDPKGEGKYLAYVTTKKRVAAKSPYNAQKSNGIPLNLPEQCMAWGETRKAALHVLARKLGQEPSVTVMILAGWTDKVLDFEQVADPPKMTAQHMEKLWSVMRWGPASFPLVPRPGAVVAHRPRV